MKINRDYFDNPIIPEFVLCKANKERIGVIQCSEKTAEVKYNDLNEIAFTTYRNINDERNPYYDAIDIMKYILLPDIGFFSIADCTIQSEGTEDEYKQVTARSYECLMGQKYLETFLINQGITGSIDNVQFYNPNDVDKSLLHRILEKCPDWTIGHVDTGLKQLERSFEIDRQDIYSFLTTDVADAFGCIFCFDTLTNTIHAYQEENVGMDTDIHVSYNNLLQSTNLSSSIDDIKTCLTITGADDLNIREVNMGSDRIYNFDYFNSTEYMSHDLYDAYNAWLAKQNGVAAEYTEKLKEYQDYYRLINEWTHTRMPSTHDKRYLGYGSFSIYADAEETSTASPKNSKETKTVSLENCKEIGTVSFEKAETVQVVNDISTLPEKLDATVLYIVVPDSSQSSDSTDCAYEMYRSSDSVERFNVNSWVGYALNPLNEQLAVYQQKLTVATNYGKDTKSEYYLREYLPIYATVQGLKAQIASMSDMLHSKETEKKERQDSLQALQDQVAMDTYFTPEQYAELSTFIREDELNSDNFVVTDASTDKDYFDTLNELLTFGQKELAQAATPQLSFSANMSNIFAIPEFSKLYGSFDVGNYIWVSLRDDYHIKTRLLGMHLNFYELDDFAVTFGNVARKAKTRYTDVSEMIKAGTSAATSLSFHSANWNQAAKTASNITTLLDEGLAAAGKSLTNSASSEVLLDERGLFINTVSGDAKDKDSIFLGNGQMLFTNDAWKTVSTAIGRSEVDGKNQFGVFANFCIASYIEGSRIVGGSITGTTFNNGNGTFSVDEAGNLTATSATIKGNVIADTGFFGGEGGFRIGEGKIYSNSKNAWDATEPGVYIGTDGIALGAYDESTESSPFMVTPDGKVTATDLQLVQVRDDSSFGTLQVKNKVTQGRLAGNSYFTSTADNPFGEDEEGNKCIEQIKEIAAGVVADDASADAALESAKAYTDTALENAKDYTDAELDAALSEKADVNHSHVLADVKGLQTALDGKADTLHTHSEYAATSHGTHVSYSMTTPVMDGAASVGSAATVARSDHRHPTDTSRAAANHTHSEYAATSHTHNEYAASSHTHSDYVNQNAFSKVTVGDTTITADTATDTLTLAGSNVTITPDTANDKVTIGITKANVTAALGYTPPTTNTTYGVATSSTLGLVKSGTDITVDSSGNVSVNDDSHNHTIANVDGLQTALDGKAASSHTHSEYAASSHTHSVYANQNAFSNVAVGSTTIAADTATDTLTLAGSNVTLTPDTANDKLTIGITKSNVVNALGYTPPTTNTTYSNASTSSAGLMSASDKSKLDGITSSADSVSVTQKLTSGTEIGSVTVNGSATKLYAPTNTDTHYSSKNVVGSSTATSNTSSALTNGNVYLNSVENGAVTSSHKISGSGATTVTTDSSGNIIISSTDTNTNTDTKNTAGSTNSSSKLFLIGATSQAANPQTYSHETVYAGTDGHVYSNGKQAVNLSDTQALTNKTYNGYTLGDACAKGVDTSAASGSTNLITSGAMYTALAGKASSSHSHSGYASSTHTHNYAGSSSAGGSAYSALELADSNGNLLDVGSLTQPVYFNGGQPEACTYTLEKSVPSDAVFTDTVYTHPSYTARTGAPTANQTPAFGGTFSVTQPVSNSTGHITAMTTRTVKIPSTVATTNSAGLMSAADKVKLDGITDSIGDNFKFNDEGLDIWTSYSGADSITAQLDTTGGHPSLAMVITSAGNFWGDYKISASASGKELGAQYAIIPNSIDDGWVDYYMHGYLPTQAFHVYNSSGQHVNSGYLDSEGITVQKGSFASYGADYAEHWEWEDGNVNNEDRVGLFVTFTGNKIRLSQSGDNLHKVAIVSASPAVVGDDDGKEWKYKYLTDVYGRFLYEEVTDSKGRKCQNRIISPEFDETLEYVKRSKRPEWDYIGTHGKLVVRDDGTCQPDSFCVPTDGGIATASEDGFYVMERLDDNHIRIYIR